MPDIPKTVLPPGYIPATEQSGTVIEKRKIPFDILDSIRGIAALYVAIAHCRGTLWIGGSEFSKMFPRSGWGVWDYFMFGSSMLTRLAVEFVIVFFVLSGFSIAHSLSSNKSPLQFYKRRFIRIYPPYVVALVWAGLVFLVTRYWHPEWYDGSLTQFAFVRTNEMNSYFDGQQILKNLVYLPGHGFITPFWSLTYEVIFYLLAPFLLRRVHLYALISFVLFAINILLPAKVYSLGLPIYIHEFLFTFNIYFAVGVLLYTHYKTAAAWFTRFGKLTWLFVMAAILAVMYGVNIYFQVETVYSFVVSSLLGIVLILYFLRYSVRIKWLMNVGRFSYTLYITHFATVFLYLGLYWLIIKPKVPYILNYFVWIPAVLLVVFIAWMQYLLVEKRSKNLLNRLRSRSVQRK
jgi:peptidoglycan/LPS O-acetylase OafA/YrhL